MGETVKIYIILLGKFYNGHREIAGKRPIRVADCDGQLNSHEDKKNCRKFCLSTHSPFSPVGLLANSLSTSAHRLCLSTRSLILPIFLFTSLIVEPLVVVSTNTLR